jgi:hypothetical protein
VTVRWIRRLVAGRSPRRPGFTHDRISGICDGQSCTGTGFSSSLLGFPLTVSSLRCSVFTCTLSGGWTMGSLVVQLHRDIVSAHWNNEGKTVERPLPPQDDRKTRTNFQARIGIHHLLNLLPHSVCLNMRIKQIEKE